MQRSIEDQSVIVATYEGEHTHPMEATPSSNVRSGSAGSAGKQGGRTMTMDLTRSTTSRLNEGMLGRTMDETPQQLQQMLVDHMASSLTNDPKFTAAIAAAFSENMHEGININPPH